MHRHTIPALALALLAGAGCVSRPSTTEQPSPTTASTGDGAMQRGGPRGGPRDGHRSDQMLFRGITLSDAQRQQVDSINAKYRTQMQTLRENAGDDRRQAFQQMRDLMERRNAEVRTVLTADQQKVFDQNVEEMRSRMRERMGDRGGPPPGR